MKMLAQHLSNGRPFVVDAPIPQLEPGRILVRNRYSAVSSGTEGATVRSARKNIVAKALARPKDVRAVLDLVQRQGVVAAYRAVSKKLDSYSPLGYSCAGRVVAVGPDVSGFEAGDLVACAGVGYANHAEYVVVPTNLCARLAPDADLKLAAYNTLGAIAMQGARQADLRLGETCVVIGLGIVGVLTCKLMQASGVTTIGVDVLDSAVAQARKLAIDAHLRNAPALDEIIATRTRGLGADAVVVAASTSSLDPINYAGKIARHKGRVVVLGDVPTGFDRNPDYYPKELELRMSCSYGPGRYDLEYEEKGRDYPPGYARWTEQRNMQAFQDLIRDNKLQLDALTTHLLAIDDAPQAYDMILRRNEPYLGVLIEYPEEDDATDVTQIARNASNNQDVRRVTRDDANPEVGYAFIGAGSYAQGSLLPNMPNSRAFRPVAILTRSGASALRVAEKFGFPVLAPSADAIFTSDQIAAVFIATRHNLHAELVLRALRSGKSVFVEKPLCLTLDEFVELRATYDERADAGTAQRLMVGFNRRFAPTARALKDRLGNAPLAIAYRVNAGAIPSTSWIQDAELGGGRILGEVCHFIDFAAWLANDSPSAVYAAAMRDPNALNDTLTIALRFGNGSIANINYFANGGKSLAKERIEVYQSGQTYILDDFRSLARYDARGSQTLVRGRQDKGQREMLRRFAASLAPNGTDAIAPDEIFRSTLATFAARESLASRREVELQ